MESYKSEFIDFMVESDVLKFGDFTLKSGRKSPFFMNAGAYVTGSQLRSSRRLYQQHRRRKLRNRNGVLVSAYHSRDFERGVIKQ